MFLMLSAAKATNHNIINLRNTLELVDTIEQMGAQFDVCDGYWKGHREDSVRLHYTNDTLEQTLVLASRVMNAFEQEAILYVDDLHQGYLLTPDGNSEFIGVWHQVTAEAARAHDSYTIINGQHYVCL